MKLMKESFFEEMKVVWDKVRADRIEAPEIVVPKMEDVDEYWKLINDEITKPDDFSKYAEKMMFEYFGMPDELFEEWLDVLCRHLVSVNLPGKQDFAGAREWAVGKWFADPPEFGMDKSFQ
jgi:hypothetical protein